MVERCKDFRQLLGTVETGDTGDRVFAARAIGNLELEFSQSPRDCIANGAQSHDSDPDILGESGLML